MYPCCGHEAWVCNFVGRMNCGKWFHHVRALLHVRTHVTLCADVRIPMCTRVCEHARSLLLSQKRPVPKIAPNRSNYSGQRWRPWLLSKGAWQWGSESEEGLWYEIRFTHDNKRFPSSRRALACASWWEYFLGWVVRILCLGLSRARQPSVGMTH